MNYKEVSIALPIYDNIEINEEKPIDLKVIIKLLNESKECSLNLANLSVDLESKRELNNILQMRNRSTSKYLERITEEYNNLVDLKDSFKHPEDLVYNFKEISSGLYTFHMLLMSLNKTNSLPIDKKMALIYTIHTLLNTETNKKHSIKDIINILFLLHQIIS